MGQRKEKYARRLLARMEAVEKRMDAVETKQMNSDRYIAALQEIGDRYRSVIKTQRGQYRQSAEAARSTARRWKLNAALLAVLLVLVAACCIAYASAQEAEMEPENAQPVQLIPTDGSLPGDDVPALVRCALTEEEIEAAENEMIEEALLARAVRLEDVLVTHYDCCLECCGKTDGITASGLRATPGVTVAVDPDVIPLGADVLVDYGDGTGLHYYRADDVGGAVKGNHIDLCVDSHERADELSRRQATVWWVIP